MLGMTPEQIVQKRYNATMDSVNLLNAGKPIYMTDDQWADCVKRNVDHLKIMVQEDCWTEAHDLTPFHEAIATYG
jgi:hypothetical protein